MFASEGRSEADLRYFLTEILTPKHLASAGYGKMSDMTNQLAIKYPDWSRHIHAIDADHDFIMTVRGTIGGMEQVMNDLLADGYKLYGLTNWASDTFKTLTVAYPNLIAKFEKIIVSGEVGLRKPDAAIFHLAAQEFCIPQTVSVYYFDDKHSNTEAARQAVGWNGIVFKDAHTIRTALAL